jgi:ribose transport system substrate-binding protein
MTTAPAKPLDVKGCVMAKSSRVHPAKRRRSTMSLVALVAACVTVGAVFATQATGSSGTLKPAQVKVALVPGGPHPYFQPWIQAGKQANTAFKLGSVTFNETAGWDQTKQNDVLNSLAAQGYNAFGIFGVSPDTINTTFSSLKRKGFAVASLASCPAGKIDTADFCLATDAKASSYEQAKLAIKAMGGHGNLVHLTGNKLDSNTTRRIAGVQQAVDETHGQVKLIDTVTDIDKDLQTAQKAVADLLAAKGSQINAIVNTAYNPSVASAEAVKQQGLPIKVITFNDDPAILAGLRDGSITATVIQNPAGQAYVGAYALMKLAGGCKMKKPGVAIDSGYFVVTKANLATYKSLTKSKTKQLIAAFNTKYLSC